MLRSDLGPSAQASRDPSRDSSMQRGTSLDVHYDEKDIVKVRKCFIILIFVIVYMF